jgi:hypothetical protein
VRELDEHEDGRFADDLRIDRVDPPPTRTLAMFSGPAAFNTTRNKVPSRAFSACSVSDKSANNLGC